MRKTHYTKQRRYIAKWQRFDGLAGAILRCIVSGHNVMPISQRLGSFQVESWVLLVFDNIHGQALGPILEQYQPVIEDGREIELNQQHIDHFLNTQPYLSSLRLDIDTGEVVCRSEQFHL